MVGVSQRPVADPGGPHVSAVNAPIAFDGTGSSDPDGDPLGYDWYFGDTYTATGATPGHTYGAVGIYDVCLSYYSKRFSIPMFM